MFDYYVGLILGCGFGLKAETLWWVLGEQCVMRIW